MRIEELKFQRVKNNSTVSKQNSKFVQPSNIFETFEQFKNTYLCILKHLKVHQIEKHSFVHRVTAYV